MVCITHVKLRVNVSLNLSTLTTSPWSHLNSANPDKKIKLPSAYTSADIVHLTVPRIESVGKRFKVYICTVCHKKILENSIGKNSFNCVPCGVTYRKSEKLHETTLTTLNVKQEGVTLDVVVSEEVLKPLLPIDSTEASLLDDVLGLENICLSYNKFSKEKTLLTMTLKSTTTTTTTTKTAVRPIL